MSPDWLGNENAGGNADPNMGVWLKTPVFGNGLLKRGAEAAVVVDVLLPAAVNAVVDDPGGVHPDVGGMSVLWSGAREWM